MTREEARQIIASWLASSKGEKGQCGYIEGWFYEKDAEAFRMAIEALEQEPKRGKWILKNRETDGNYRYMCSECGHIDIQAKTQEVPYCWYCGASMESDNE